MARAEAAAELGFGGCFEPEGRGGDAVGDGRRVLDPRTEADPQAVARRRRRLHALERRARGLEALRWRRNR